MGAGVPPAAVWRLRPDVETIGSVAADGTPSLLVHDPVAETFDRVAWPESDLVLLLRRPATLAELGERFARRNPPGTLRPAQADLAAYLNRLAGNGWLSASAAWPKVFVPRPEAGWAAKFSRLLFLQIPLVKPGAFLRSTARAADVFTGPFATAALAIAGLFGLCLALPRWEEFAGTVAAGANPAGVPRFLLALVALKTVHELAHAYTATRCGARVKSMGVALFFLMPLPFTDVTDGWRLEWPERLRVAVAGLRAELAVAALSVFLWALAPPGEAAAVLARLATVAVLSTLATNLNPGLRFDGYFILVCLTRMENLRPRGANALRALVWRCVFGVGTADGAEGERLAFGKAAALRAYAVYALLYRVFVGCSLIALAYAMLPKALALPVVAGEAALFFIAPLCREGALLRRLRGGMRFTRGTGILLLLLAVGGVWFFGRWPRRLSFPAVTRAEVEEDVRARRGGVLRSVGAVRGESVVAGQILAELEAPEEAHFFELARWAVREAEIGVAQTWTGALSRRESLAREAERKRREDELAALREQSALLAVRAPASGVLAAWDEALVPGVAVRGGARLGGVVQGAAARLSCYPDVETAHRFDVGAEAFFFPDSGEERLRGKVVAIGRAAVEILEDAELAPVLAGGVPKVKVIVLLDAAADRAGQTGTLSVRSRPESLAARAGAWLRNLAVRESSF